MSELYIDPKVFESGEGKPLPPDHRAKMFAAGLPDAHPVKRLLHGESQWLGDNANILYFLRLFCEVYGDRLSRAEAIGDLHPRPLDRAAADAEVADFERLFPDNVLFRGRRYSFRTLLKNARDAVAIAAKDKPHLRDSGLEAFILTFAALVRAVRPS